MDVPEPKRIEKPEDTFASTKRLKTYAWKTRVEIRRSSSRTQFTFIILLNVYLFPFLLDFCLCKVMVQRNLRRGDIQMVCTVQISFLPSTECI
jgi:hypothetical protein